MPKAIDIPLCPGAPAQRSSSRTTRDCQISMVTPLFGGGAEAGKPDDTQPIRGTSIRGQLQFWWRATRGAKFATYPELYTRHIEVWGNTDKASPIEIEVRDVTMAQPKPCARYQWNSKARRGQGGWSLKWESPFATSKLSYVLFPFQGKSPSVSQPDSEEPPASFIETGSFTLRIRYPDTLRREVETAVWAWVNFGGLGARTRRGCGALLCRELAPGSITDLQNWLSAGTNYESASGQEWPTLPSSILVAETPETPVQAWKRVVEILQLFRQGEGFARNTGGQPSRPGRSRYPEPETIRRVTDRRASQHARLSHIPDDAFPRAELGLPIVFHYQGQGEPDDTVLYPACDPHLNEKRERMASPFILKPLALANGQSISLALKLRAPILNGIELRQRQGQNDTVLPLPQTTAIRGNRLATYRDSPLSGAASGSALDAFVDFLTSQAGFKEVTR